MATQLVDSHFFLEPEQEEDAPDCNMPFSRSRAIDITATIPSGTLQLSSHPFYVTTAREIKSYVEQALMRKDVCSTLYI
jgi:hypothetical protein